MGSKKRGFAVFMTGFSAAGKSTLAAALVPKLLEEGAGAVTLLDGDEVRRMLSSELGYSRAHRELNIHRIGFVAAEVARHGGVVVCCPIAPYDDARKKAREMVQAHGGFVLVHVATEIKECERRDPKGLYAKARAGVLRLFTGVSDPYEPPKDAELTLDMGTMTPGEGVDRIMAHLKREGYLKRAE